MLTKLAAKLNPFHRGPRPAPVDPSDPVHAHSFSCGCKRCVEHTNELTRARLKRQGA